MSIVIEANSGFCKPINKQRSIVLDPCLAYNRVE